MIAHTDIAATGWVSRLPRAWLPYVLLARLDRPIGVWLLFLPGLWGILLARAGWPETVRLIAAVRDRQLGDAGSGLRGERFVGSRHRSACGAHRGSATRVGRDPGASLAAVPVRVAGLVGLIVLLSLNRLAQELGVASLVLVAVYPLAKRVTWWPQLAMGFTFGFGAPMGYAAATGRIDLSLALLYGAAIFWDLGFDTIYAHQDREDDALVGVRSTARLFGERTRPFLGACYTAAVVLVGLAGWSARLGGWFWPALTLPAALLAWQVATLDIHDPRHCLRLFRANREVGLAFGLAILLGAIQAGMA